MLQIFLVLVGVVGYLAILDHLRFVAWTARRRVRHVPNKQQQTSTV